MCGWICNPTIANPTPTYDPLHFHIWFKSTPPQTKFSDEGAYRRKPNCQALQARTSTWVCLTACPTCSTCSYGKYLRAVHLKGANAIVVMSSCTPHGGSQTVSSP
jgi:hypothetical protein